MFDVVGCVGVFIHLVGVCVAWLDVGIDVVRGVDGVGIVFSIVLVWVWHGLVRVLI